MGLNKEIRIKKILWFTARIIFIGGAILQIVFFVLEKTNVIENKDKIEDDEGKTAKLEIDDNVFSWSEDNKKSTLRIQNYSNVEGQNITSRAYLFYGKSVETIKYENAPFISPNGFVAIESSLEYLPIGKLPDSIMVCMSHKSENSIIKTQYNYILKDIMKGLSQPLFGQFTYNKKLIEKNYFQDQAPICFDNISNFIVTSDIVRAKRADSIKQLSQIRLHAQKFLSGLNLRNLSKIQKYSSKELFKNLSGKNEDFKYGFNTDITILNHTTKTAEVKVLLTSKGWQEFILKDTYYMTQNINRKSESFYDFLQLKNNTWIGRLKKENNIWQFSIHENSALGKK